MPKKISDALGRTLDARPDRLDLRDRAYIPPVATLPPCVPGDADIRRWVPAYVKAGLILDQGQEGACTGFGLACVIHYLLWRRQLEAVERGRLARVSTRMLYHLARFYDEWPGEDYEGSSCRGALKAWHRHGVCAESLWPFTGRRGKVEFVAPADDWDLDAMQRRLGVYYRIDCKSVVDMQAAIKEIGAIYVSAEVHDGWGHLQVAGARGKGTSRKRAAPDGHASLPVIGRLDKAESVGGHAFALVGYNPTGFVVQNSWGPEWGRSGFAVLPYEDWVKHGTDAWACALGVPAVTTTRSSAVLVPSTADGLRPAGAVGAAPAARSRTPRPEVNEAVTPWTLDTAYQHTVVLGNEGRPISRIVTHASGEAGVMALVKEAPAAWFKTQGGPRRVAIYAHGGLNSEEGSLKRIQVLAPYFKANGIYPVFITWKTGVVESMAGILEDQLAYIPRRETGLADVLGRLADRAAEVLDRTIEVSARPVVKPIWSQMKQNAEASVEPERGSVLVAQALAALAAGAGSGGIEVHLVGHSAGSILLGHFLDAAKTHGLTIKSCSLYAPACSVGFAAAHYGRAAAEVLREQDLHVHLLSDQREREDTVGPYQKSLLYLVSRALEAAHKTPLLGLAEAFNPKKEAIGAWYEGDRATVQAWQQAWKGRLHVLDAPQVVTGPGTQIKSAHGCFDNDVATVTATLTRILGAPPAHPVQSLDY